MDEHETLQVLFGFLQQYQQEQHGDLRALEAELTSSNWKRSRQALVQLMQLMQIETIANENVRKTLQDAVSPAIIHRTLPWITYQVPPRPAPMNRRPSEQQQQHAQQPPVRPPQQRPPPLPQQQQQQQQDGNLVVKFFTAMTSLFTSSSSSLAGPAVQARLPPPPQQQQQQQQQPADPLLTLPRDSLFNNARTLWPANEVHSAEDVKMFLDLLTVVLERYNDLVFNDTEHIVKRVLEDKQRPPLLGIVRTLVALPVGLVRGGGGGQQQQQQQTVPGLPAAFLTAEVVASAREVVRLMVVMLAGIVGYVFKSSNNYGQGQINQVEELLGGRPLIASLCAALGELVACVGGGGGDDGGNTQMQFAIVSLVALLADTRLVPNDAPQTIMWPFIERLVLGQVDTTDLSQVQMGPNDIWPLMREGNLDAMVCVLLCATLCPITAGLFDNEGFRGSFETTFLKPWNVNARNHGLPFILRPHVYVQRGMREEVAMATARFLLRQLVILRDKLMLTDTVDVPTAADIKAHVEANPLRPPVPTAPPMEEDDLALLAAPMFALTANEDWCLSLVLGDDDINMDLLRDQLYQHGALFQPGEEVDHDVADDVYSSVTMPLTTALVGLLMDKINTNAVPVDIRPIYFYLGTLLKSAFEDLAYLEDEIIAMLIEQDTAQWIMRVRPTADSLGHSRLSTLPNEFRARAQGDIQLVAKIVSLACAHLVREQLEPTLALIIEAMVWNVVNQDDFKIHLDGLRAPVALRNRHSHHGHGHGNQQQQANTAVRVDNQSDFDKFVKVFAFYPGHITRKDDDDDGTEVVGGSSSSSNASGLIGRSTSGSSSSAAGLARSISTTSSSSATMRSISGSSSSAAGPAGFSSATMRSISGSSSSSAAAGQPAADGSHANAAAAVTKFHRRFRTAFPLGEVQTVYGPRPSLYELRLQDHEEYELLYSSTAKCLNDIGLKELRRSRPLVKMMDLQGNEMAGVDLGGLTKHWLNRIAVQLTNRGKHLGLLMDIDEDTVGQRIIHPLADLVAESCEFFELMGKVMGVCLANSDYQATMPMGLSPVMYSMLLGQPVRAAHYEAMDRSFARAARGLINSASPEEDIAALDMVMAYDFTLPVEVSARDVEQAHIDGVSVKTRGYATIEFTPGGADETVETPRQLCAVMENRARLFFGEKTPRSYEAFVRGFRDVVPLSMLEDFDPMELLITIEGSDDIDVADWQANTRVVLHDHVDIQTLPDRVRRQVQHTIGLFWSIVGTSFALEDRARLLQFVCGVTRVPAGGFSSFTQPFTIQVQFRPVIDPATEQTAPLPVAHVCFNRLDIPLFVTRAIFENKLRQAMAETAFHVK